MTVTTKISTVTVTSSPTNCLDNCDRGICLICKNGYHVNINGKCVNIKCSNHCIKCYNHGHCLECESGYYVDKNEKCTKKV